MDEGEVMRRGYGGWTQKGAYLHYNPNTSKLISNKSHC